MSDNNQNDSRTTQELSNEWTLHAAHSDISLGVEVIEGEVEAYMGDTDADGKKRAVRLAVGIPVSLISPVVLRSVGESAKVRIEEYDAATNEKTLHNSPASGARENVADHKSYGNVDVWRLLCKASSKKEGWMKSTKVMEVEHDDPGARGCLVQVTTQQRNPDGSYAVSEAVAFIPGATHADFDFPTD